MLTDFQNKQEIFHFSRNQNLSYELKNEHVGGRFLLAAENTICKLSASRILQAQNVPHSSSLTCAQAAEDIVA
jgi:hypothetical protein